MNAAGRIAFGGLTCALASLVLAVPAPAEIREVSLSGGTLEIKAGDEGDEIDVKAGKRGVVVNDPDGVPAAGFPCEGGYPETSAVVTCPRRDVDRVLVDLGDGNDSFTGRGNLRFRVEGGKGDDEIGGGDAKDVLEGKFGDDTLAGGDGNDKLLGGVDKDKLIGGRGKDTLDGGPDRDKANGGAGKDRCIGVERARKGACD